MVNYKIVVAYDGTDYHGWQQQPTVPTVSWTLESYFQAVFKQNVNIVGASRTDAGVHALGQVARCTTGLHIEPAKILRAWNNSLPQNIHIRACELVDDSFNPQYRVTQKIYYYHLFTQRPLPFLARYGTYYSFTIDPEKLYTCLQVFVGTHDFRSFCTGYEQESTIRTIISINLVYLKRYASYRIVFIAPGFLRYMIRRIVGACLDIASSPSRSHTELIAALQEKNPVQLYYTAPAQGLLLYKIYYS